MIDKTNPRPPLSSGICAALQVKEGAHTVRQQLLEAASKLRHRGPDWSGTYIQGAHGLAHERLAICGVESGAQPLVRGDVALAVNGEIYNHQALVAPLPASIQPRTKSDCESILSLYEAARLDAPQAGVPDPTEWLNSLIGMFAFVLVDSRPGDTQHFLIARDHVGICSLYYGYDAKGTLWVASELKAIHHLVTTIQLFPPGSFWSSTEGQLRQWYTPVWYQPGWMPRETRKPDLKRIREEFTAAVQRHLMADTPYGCLVSGGLDSSLVAAIASRLCAQRVEDASAHAAGLSNKTGRVARKGQPTAWWPQLHTFCIGLEGSPDLKAAQQVADHLQSVHHPYTFTLQEGLDAISQVIYHLETYDVTTIRAGTPMFLLSRRIKTLGVKMVLTGEGADETGAGYLYFHHAPNVTELQEELVRKVRDLHYFDNLRAHKALLAWGVEGRVPFLDRKFLDFFMTQVAPIHKMCGKHAIPKGRIEKWVLREAFRGYLPDALLFRAKEQFSDGVGYGWIDEIQRHAATVVTDDEFAAATHRFPHNTPQTKEAYFVRSIFDKHFGSDGAAKTVPGGPSVACSTATAVKWDESFATFADCSGRSISVHGAALTEEDKAKKNKLLGKRKGREGASGAKRQKA